MTKNTGNNITKRVIAKKDIVRLRKEGYTWAQVAKRVGCGINSAMAIAKGDADKVVMRPYPKRSLGRRKRKGRVPSATSVKAKAKTHGILPGDFAAAIRLVREEMMKAGASSVYLDS